jgi:hypothetical protein
MLSWIVAWLVVPVVVVALATGIGFLVERATRVELAGPVLVAVGASALVVITTLLTDFPLIAPVSGAALVVLAVLGWLFAAPNPLARERRWWPVLSAGAVFACYAAPVALSGATTWAGFIKLDDTPDWMSLGDRLATVGNTTEGLAHSTYGVLMQELIGGGYPLGSFADLGVVSRLLGQDSAFVIQPFMATLAGILGFALYAVTAGLIRSDRWRAAVAFLAASSTLLFGYTLWGGVKEVTLAFLLATCAVAMVQGRDDPRPLLGQAALFAVPMAGVFVVFCVAGGVYLAPLAVVELVLVALWFGVRRAALASLVFLVVFSVLSVPTWRVLGLQLQGAGSSGLRGSEDLGNLFAPLKFQQIFGVWPTGDFRAVPSSSALTWLLVAIVAAGALAGVLIAIRAGLPAIPTLALTNLAVSIWYVFGNPWLEAKTLAVASPTMLLAAGAAFAWLAENGRLFEGSVLVAIVAVGVIASNVMGFRDVWLAPSDRMHELADIGRADLPSPALILEYNPAAARHFLARLDGEAAGEFRWNVIPLYTGQGLDKGAYAEIDDFPLTSITAYPTLVMRTDLVGSRPPSMYRLTRPGTYYDVWTLDPSAPSVIAHWPLGDHTDPAAPAPCPVVKQAIAAAGPSGRVAVAERAPLVTVPLDAPPLPTGWTAGGMPGSVNATNAGSVTTTFTVPAAGSYRGDLGGLVFGDVRVVVDGREVYSDHGRLNWTPYANPMPAIELAAGEHTLTVEYATSWRPGGSATPATLGPVVFSTTGADVPVTYVAPAKALALCGQRLDWIEAVAG